MPNPITSNANTGEQSADLMSPTSTQESDKQLDEALYAAALNGDAQKVKELLQAGADPDTASSIAPPLFAATYRGHTEVVKILLNNPHRNANPNRATDEGMTPLALAAASGKLELVKVLLEYGADPYIENNINANAFSMALINNKHEVLVQFLKNPPSDILKNKPINTDDEISKISTITAQSALIIFMQSIGYETISFSTTDSIKKMFGLDHEQESNITRGVCFGVSNAAGEALLIKGGYEEFIKHLEDIAYIVRQATIEAVKENGNTTKSIADKVKEKIQSHVAASIKVVKTNEEENNIYDLLALCDKVAIYQNLNEHTDLIDPDKKDDLAISLNSPYLSGTIAQSIELENQGGKINVARSSGIYTLDELTEYLHSLRNMFESTIDDKPFPHPISITLRTITSRGTGHSIELGFDCDQHKWIYIDPNRPPCYITEDKQLAEKIFHERLPGLGLEHRKFIPFAAIMYTTRYDENKNKKDEQMKPFIAAWENSPEYIKLHTPTEEKAAREDSGHTWADVAAKAGQVTLTQSLVSHTNPLQKREKINLAEGYSKAYGTENEISAREKEPDKEESMFAQITKSGESLINSILSSNTPNTAPAKSEEPNLVERPTTTKPFSLFSFFKPANTSNTTPTNKPGPPKKPEQRS